MGKKTIFTIATLLAASLSFAASDDDPTKGDYRLKIVENASGDTSCSLVHHYGNHDDEGVRQDHLKLLMARPGEAGEKAKLFIQKYFPRSRFSTDADETAVGRGEIGSGGVAGLASLRTPNTDDCDILGRLKNALNNTLANPPAPTKTPSDRVNNKVNLACEGRGQRHLFNLTSNGDLDWTFQTKVNDQYTSWGTETVLVNANKKSDDCSLRIIHFDSTMELCLPTIDPNGKQFKAELKSMNLDGLKINEPITLTCKSQSDFYQKNPIKKALEQLDLTTDKETSDQRQKTLEELVGGSNTDESSPTDAGNEQNL